MKALILAAGRGKRLGGLTEEKNKCMIEINGRPLIGSSLDSASRLKEVSEIIVVVGYQAEDIKEYCGKTYNGKPIKYVLQEKQRGLVHAIECAKAVIGQDDFFLFLGDEMMINPRQPEMAKKFQNEKLFAVCGVIKVDNPNLISRTYGIREKEGFIVELVEKPDINAIEQGRVSRDVMGTGNCLFQNSIFSYIEKTPVNPKRGERELPDLIGTAVKDGKPVKSFLVCDMYFNLNLRQDESYFAHFSEEDRK